MRLTPIIHEADEFDFSFAGRRNQCVQHTTQCLENRSVFPAADFEVSGIQSRCDTSNCHERPLSPRENVSVLLLKQVTARLPKHI